MAKKPWMKWWANDWLSDESLRACSYAARGLWADMLSLMHKSHQRGTLPFEGLDRTAERLSRQLGGSPGEIRPLLAELLDEGVPSVSEDGRSIVSRKMYREEQKAQKCSEAGRRGGGSPTFKGDSKGPPKGQYKGDSSLSSSDSDSSSPKGNQRTSDSHWGEFCAQVPEGSPLLTEQFRAAWLAWVQYRRETKRKLTPSTINRQARQLEQMGHDRGIEAIEQSIRNGWAGLFEPDGGAKATGGSSKGARSTQRQRQADRGEFAEDLDL